MIERPRSRWWSAAAVLALSTDARAEPGPRYEFELGLLTEHIAGGYCDSGNGFGSTCGNLMSPGLELAAGQVIQPRRVVSVVTRELVSDTSSGAFGVLRSYLGVGARLSPFASIVYVELTVGGDLQLGSVPSGEAGVTTGANFATSLRIGVQPGRWAVVGEGFIAPTAIGTLGLTDYGIGVLASRAFGN